MAINAVPLLGFLGVVLPLALPVAEPKGPEVSPAAAELIGRMAKEYKGLGAYSDDGEVTLTQTVGSTTVRLSRRMPLRFVRPNHLYLDLGPLVLVTDDRGLTAYDTVRKLYAEFPYDPKAKAAPGGPKPTTDDAGFNDSERQKLNYLLDFWELPAGEAYSAEVVLGALGARLSSPVLTLLLEDRPEAILVRGARKVDVEKGQDGGQRLGIDYPDRSKIEILTSRIGRVESVRLLLPAGEFPKGGVPEIVWVASQPATGVEETKKQVRENITELKGRKYARGIGQGAPLGTRVPVTPPKGTTVLGSIRRFFASIF